MIDEKNIPIAYAEVLAVLEALGEDYKNKLPAGMLETMERKKDKTFTKVFDKDEKNPELSREALALISWLNLKYWCEDEQEKEELIRIYNENEIRHKLLQYKRMQEREDT